MSVQVVFSRPLDYDQLATEITPPTMIVVSVKELCNIWNREGSKPLLHTITNEITQFDLRINDVDKGPFVKWKVASNMTVFQFWATYPSGIGPRTARFGMGPIA